MIKAVYQLTKPDDAEASLTLTMTVGEWRRFRAQLADKLVSEYPAWRIATMIADLLERAHDHFSAAGETVEP